MAHWTEQDIPSQSGKIVVITGATSGLGFATAVYFARTGAKVILASRNLTKGEEKLAKIKEICPQCEVILGQLDLCCLESIKEFSDWFLKEYQKLDILINNAGVMYDLTREIKLETTQDGFETMVGTNHFGHFALTGRLLPALRKSKEARAVNMSSLMSHFGQIDFNDFPREKSFKPFREYATSKLANLLFTFELQRRSDAGQWGLTVTAAHPGYARTERTLIREVILFESKVGAVTKWINSKITHSAEDGALITMYAATSSESTKGGYYAPQNLFEFKGPPGVAWIPSGAKNVEVAKKLWEVSETLTNVTYPSNEMSVTA